MCGHGMSVNPRGDVWFLARLYEVQKSYCSQPGVGVHVRVSVCVRVGFQVKVFG